MRNEDRAAFGKMLALVAEQYGKPMSPELLGFYFDGLRDMRIEAVRSALNAHVRNTERGQFMPKIADLIRAIEGDVEQAAYTALAAVNSRYNGSAELEVDLIAQAVIRDMGGWRALGQRDAEEWQSFGSKDFVKRYCIYKARGDIESEQKLLAEFEQKLLDRAQP